MSEKYPKAFLDLCKSVTAKRSKTVIEHILKHGHITTEELKEKYGHNHPPRATRDVREHGIPLETFRVTGSDGRKIAAYRFGDVSKKRFRKLSGRTGLSKKILLRNMAANASYILRKWMNVNFRLTIVFLTR
jgi:hypothetical protein